MKALWVNEVSYCIGSMLATWANCRTIPVLGSKPKAAIANEYAVFVSTFFNWSDKFIFSLPNPSTTAFMMAIAGRSFRLCRSNLFGLMLFSSTTKYAEVAENAVAITIIASKFLRAHFENARMRVCQWLGGVNSTGTLSSAGTDGLFSSSDIDRTFISGLAERSQYM
jgi:hypothetical protein